MSSHCHTKSHAANTIVVERSKDQHQSYPTCYFYSYIRYMSITSFNSHLVVRTALAYTVTVQNVPTHKLPWSIRSEYPAKSDVESTLSLSFRRADAATCLGARTNTRRRLRAYMANDKDRGYQKKKREQRCCSYLSYAQQRPLQRHKMTVL
jgi:hypothetical protein